jgi:hypothetical protein
MDNKSLTNIDKLDADNYQTWKLLIEMVLLHQDLWSVVDGSWARPSEGDKDLAEWKKRANKAKALIILSLQLSQLEHVRRLETPSEIWEKLKEVHEPKGRQHRLFLRRKFFTMKMQEGDSMQEHINKIKSLQDKLESMGATLQEEDVLTVLLASLPETYETLVIALESAGDNLTEQQVIVRLLQEEARRKENALSNGKKEGEAFLTTKGKFKGIPKAQKKTGSGSGPLDKSKDKCHSCGKVGHWAKDCRSKQSYDKKVTKASSEANEVHALDAFMTVGTSSGNPWYIDSGASEHFSHHLWHRR